MFFILVLSRPSVNVWLRGFYRVFSKMISVVQHVPLYFTKDSQPNKTTFNKITVKFIMMTYFRKKTLKLKEMKTWIICCLFLGLNISPRSFVSDQVVRGEKCDLDKNPKSETNCPTFYQADFVSREGFLWAFLGETTTEKRFKLLAFGLMLIGQVKRPIWIQRDIYRGRSIPAFEELKLLSAGKYRVLYYMLLKRLI